MSISIVTECLFSDSLIKDNFKLKDYILNKNKEQLTGNGNNNNKLKEAIFKVYPDIDSDIADIRRGEVKEYLRKKFKNPLVTHLINDGPLYLLTE